GASQGPTRLLHARALQRRTSSGRCRWVQDPTSLDIPIGEDGDVTLADLIEAPEAVNPHTAAEAAALRDCVAEALAQLTPREERILRMRFGIGMTDHTLEQVGKTFGLTRERIRQIEVKALQK